MREAAGFATCAALTSRFAGILSDGRIRTAILTGSYPTFGPHAQTENAAWAGLEPAALQEEAVIDAYLFMPLPIRMRDTKPANNRWLCH